MNRYKEIKSKIQQHYDELPKNQKKIAEFYLENFDKIPFLNVQEVSEATHASVASVVRFTQRTGFKGFSEIRDEITNALQDHLRKKENFPLLDGHNIKEDILTAVANQEINNINDTINLNDRESFDKAVDIIFKAKKVFTAGLGISNLLAEILSYQLTQLGIFSKNFTNSYATFLEQILLLDKNDIIITLSFPPYSIDTIEAAKFAKEKGLKVISITNKQSSPISFYSDSILVVSSQNMLYTNSFAAISVLINAIATRCALKNKNRAVNMLNEMDAVSERMKNTIV